ncbi:uncharacterized protein LOC108242481 [Kryptolebias marmoratus]|uniref:Microtubule-associated protein futsch-like n=1 Tax=Kryptolebias marmoratus TaxID=37003 RepID=A0A3Q3AM99_KRYMA|nr:uncharacterized protein LOC108242481 [Kryptolebias marmoratus]
MSCYKHKFQCFSTVGGEDSHQHHATHLPRIPHHGVVAHHDLLERCCLCSEYQHTQAMEAAETNLLPFCHPSYHHHPHQYALRELSRPEETRSFNECHLHHQRFHKRVMLVKNSDPSCRKTIVLRRRSLHSFALFLEEVSELMHYHIRKLYTQDGRKIDSVQSLLQCPGVLICVGREPTHPSVMENFQRTFNDKLPKLSAKSRATGHTDGNERVSTMTSVVPPNLESDSQATKRSEASEKSGPDGTDSPDVVGFGPPTGDSVREDDIEKLVRVNKDGSLTMEMKVRFRLQNDQTLQWSTKVRKTTGGTCEPIQGHNNPCFAQVCDVSCSESENISADEACFTQRYQGHTEEHHCAHCCSHCQDHDNCKNTPRTHAARRCILTSSSSASSVTVVSRKTVVERQTVSRSSEELTQEVVERQTCVTQSAEAAETVEFCTVQSETCSPKSKLDNSETAGLNDCTDKELYVKTAQESEEEQSVCSQILDEENPNDDGKDTASRTSSQNSKPETKKTTGAKMLNIGSPTPHPPTSSTDKTSNPSGRSKKSKASKPSHACHCGVSADPQDESKGKNKTQAEEEGEIKRDQSSAMSVKSESKEETRGSKSAMSVHSNASTKCISDVLDDAFEQIQTGNDKETQQRPSSSMSVKSVKSSAASEQRKSEEDVETERALSAVSAKSKASVKSKASRRSCAAGEKQAEEDLEQRTPSVMSAFSNVSAELKHIAYEASEEESSQHSAEENECEAKLRAQSAKSEKRNGSRKSRLSEVTVTESPGISDNVNNEGESEQRPQSTHSVKSVRSVKSNMSSKSSKSKTTEVLSNGSGDNTEDGNNEGQGEEKDVSYTDGVEETTDTSVICDEEDDQQETTGRSNCMSVKSVKSNSSVRSSQSKCGDKSDGEDANDKERGPSVMSVKSAKSTFSNTSAKSSPSKPSDGSAADLTKQKRKRAQSNMSTASAKSSKSNTSAACVECVPTEVYNDESDETVTEGETGRRSVSSVSVQSDNSDISLRSNRSNLSAFNVAAEDTEILCGENEDVTAESRATSSSPVESHPERTSSALSAKSAKSCKSTRSTKSNTSKLCLSVNPDEQKYEETQERAQSAMSAKTIESTNSARSTRSKCSTDVQHKKDSKTLDKKNDTEQAEERSTSSISARTVQSQVSADRPQSASSVTSVNSSASVQSVKSNADVQTPTGAEIPDEGDGADKTQVRAESGLSAKTVQSTTSIKSTKSKKCDDPADENRSNHKEQRERSQSNMSARSEKSTKSNVSRTSKRSKVVAVCLKDEINNSEERTIEGESGENNARPMSPQSVDSNISIRTNKSNWETDVPLDEDSKATDEENDEQHEERPPSSMSTKSDQSSVSENIKSIKSAERTQSALSTKSAKSCATEKSGISLISEVCSGKSPVQGNNAEETYERAQSALSAKTVESTNSVKSAKSKKLDDPAKKDNVERAPSNLSARSEKSTVSNASTVSKRKKVSEGIPNEECDQKTKTERVSSSMSTKSAQSSVSEISVMSAEGTSSVVSIKSTKSNTSGISVKTNVSDVQSGKPSAPPDEVDSEDEERAHSVVSVKSITSVISVKSTQSAGLNDENHKERPPSSLSAESETSPKSNVSTASERSQTSEVPMEDSFDRTDVRIVEGEKKDKEISLTSPQSDRLQSPAKDSSEITDDRNNTEQSENRTPSSMSAKSVQTHVSERSSKSADRPQSAKSAKSAKSQASARSVKTDVSVESGTTSQIPDKDDDQERTYSALSAKTTKTTYSTTSTKVKEKVDISGDEGHEDRSPSNMSTRSARSAVSTLSQKSKTSGVPCEPSDEKVNEDKPQEEEEEEEDTESQRSMSSMSIHSAKTDISLRSNRSKCSINVVDEEDITRPMSNASTEVLSGNNTPEGGHDDRGTQDRSESVVSVKSRISTKSNRSKVSAATTEKSVLEFDREERPESTETIKSNISARSKHSKCPNAAAAQSSESPKEDCSEETAEDRAASCTSAKTSLSYASERSSKSHSTRKSANASQASADKSSKSRHSDGTGKSKTPKALEVSPELGANISNENTEEDTKIRTLSPVSAKSAKTNVTSMSTKSKASGCSERSENSEASEQTVKQEDQAQRTQSVLSVRSNASASTIESNTTRCTPSEMIKNKEPDAQCAKSTKSTKSKKSKAHELKTEELSSHSCDGYTEEKSERTPSVMSVKSNISAKSEKSNVSDVTVEERTTYTEERIVSPVSARSNLSDAFSRSDLPSVTVEESEDRSPTAPSTKSKASVRSKKSKTSGIQGKKSDEKSQSSLSVRSHLSVKSKKSIRTDISTANISSKGARQAVSDESAPSLHKKDKEDATDNESCKTNKSIGQGTEETSAEITVEKSTASQSAQQTKATKQQVICHAESSESDISQTLSSSDIIKEICETFTPEQSNVLKRIANDHMEAEDNDDGVIKDTDDFELVTSTLPNSSPTEVVNEWLKRLPEEGDIYNLEEFNEDCDELKSHAEAEEGNRAGDSDKTMESEAENSKVKDEENVVNVVQSNECQASTEAAHEGNSSTQKEDGSKIINSSIQVMKVLLNPKLDRCNSLPEISPVYGRKLSTSAKGLLDCLVKLQLIDHNPKSANEKDKRYQELMRILQSLWLSDPQRNEHVQNTKEHHSVDEEYNHTSSSGVDVNSGSTDSGKSSDGVKNSSDLNGLKAQEETKAQWQLEREEVKQEDEDPGTNETIRSNDSPREPPETPSSSNKTSGDSSSNGQKLPEEAETESQEDTKSESPILSQKAQLAKMQSQDLNPVWALTLLTKIEKQFMTHYINAMQEFKVRWNLEDSDQLDLMINELKTEVQKRIQTSIDREVRRIQSQAGLPRPPKEAMSRVSAIKSEERGQRRKIRHQQSMDSQTEKSDDSATETSYSDQRNENSDECCPCETCIRKDMTSSLPLAAIVRSTAPVVMKSNLQTVLLMKTGASAHAQCQDVTQQDEQAPTEQTAEVFPVVSYEETSKTEDERTESESASITTTGERTSDDEAALEEEPCDAVRPGGEFKIGSKVDQEMANQFEDMSEKESEDENEEKTTVIAPVEHKSDKKENVKIGEIDKTGKTSCKELPNHVNKVNHDETDELKSVEDPCKNESKVEAMHNSREESFLTKQEADIEKTKNWLTVKKRLLPTLLIARWRKEMTQSAMCSEKNDTAIINEMVKEAESKADIAADRQTPVSNEDESEEAEGTTVEDEDDVAEVDMATTQCKSNQEENEEANTDDDISSDLAEDLAEDEFVVEKTALTSKDQTEITTAEERNAKGSFMATKRALASEKGKAAEESVVSEEDATPPTSGDESSDENDDSDTADDSSEKPDEMATTKENDVENGTAVSGDESKNETARDETSVASSTVHESDDEETVEVANFDEGGETNVASKTCAAEVLKCSSEAPTGEDESDAPETSVAEPETDVAELEGAVTSVEKVPDTENIDSDVAEESSEESSEEATTSDDEGVDNVAAVSQEGKSKDETTEDETSDETEKEEAADAATVDEETSAVSEDDSADDKNATTNEDESAEDSNSELSLEQAEKDTEDKQAAEEELVNFEERPMIAKKPDLADISENDNEEDGTDAGTTECESGKDITHEAPDAEDETAEDIEVTSEMKEGSSVETTEVEEEDGTTEGEAISSKDKDSGEGLNAFPNDESSSTGKKEQIRKVYDESNVNDQKETTDEEKQDVCDNTESDPESSREESSKVESENESDEESDNSETDEDKSENNPKPDTCESTGQEDASSVQNDDDSGEEDSEVQPENETAQEATEENEMLSEAERVVVTEELDEKESSENNAEDFQEEKSEESGTSNDGGSVEGETPREESESKCDTRENETEDHETEESKEPEKEGNQMTKSDDEEESGPEDGFKGDGAEVKARREDSTDKAEDETAQEKGQQPRADQNVDDVREFESENAKENAEESEKEDEETEALNEDWSGNQGASADGGDEAEEDSDQPEEEETDDGRQLFVINKADISDAFNKAAKATMLMPLDTLKKPRDESEDGAYADVEDSETEINSQEEVISLESKSLKNS